jgi:hypothetical protein
VDSPSDRERAKTTLRRHPLPIRPAPLVAAIPAVATCRLLPHPPTFTPVVACALFEGARFANDRSSISLLSGTSAVAEAWCPTRSERAAPADA